MKKCDYYKDLIFTDYIDGELAKLASQDLEDHLLDCSSCRLFFKEVKSKALLPLPPGKPQTPPPELWASIKQQINEENQATDPVADLMDRLTAWLGSFKILPAFSSFIVIFMVGSMALNTVHLQRAQAVDQATYLTSLLSPAAFSLPLDNTELKTPIEHYFL